MSHVHIHAERGVLAALAAALLFGAGTPAAKLLLGPISPWLLASLLYLGSGLGLAVYRMTRHTQPVRLNHSEAKWLAGAVVAGGMFGPALLMWGLSRMPASGASLLLNAEGVFTALLAWFVFRENFDRRIALGMALIVAGALVLSWPGQAQLDQLWPALAVLAACAAWAIDNNLTRKVSLQDATLIAMIKGLVAGGSNLVLALLAGATLPALPIMAWAGLLGLLSYGASLVLFVVALRELGTARTSAYFSIAPFAGAIIAVMVMGETITVQFCVAGMLMAVGIWLHLTEKHDHLHTHTFMQHAHEHTHDAHHQHTHDPPVPAGTRHAHPHRHQPLTHRHPHYPDAHHNHKH